MDDLLDIPKFLRKGKKRGRPRKIKESPPEINLYEEWDKIKQKKYGTKSVSYTHLTLPTNREV